MKRVLGLLLAGCLAACGSSSGAVTAAPPVTQASGSSAGPSTARVTKVLTVVLENHGTDAALRQMPYVASLANRYGWAKRYRALTHPSLPNYLAMAGGSTFGIRDDASPSRHPIRSSSVFDVALAHHRTAATFAEGMGSACQQGSQGRYAVKHNPWAYFASASSRAACRRHDLPIAALHSAVRGGTLPTVGLLIPDLCHDAHDCSLAAADRWVSTWFKEVLAGPDYRAGRLALVVTFDEGSGSGDASTGVLTVVVAPQVTGRVVSTALDHRSWCRWMTDLVGAPPLSGARASSSLGRAFGL